MCVGPLGFLLYGLFVWMRDLHFLSFLFSLAVDSLLTDTSIRWTPRVLLVPAFLYSLYLTLYKMDISLRQTLIAGPKGVRLRLSWLYTCIYIKISRASNPHKYGWSFCFLFQVISEGGRPKIQVEHKGETKTFYAEEVSWSIYLGDHVFLTPFSPQDTELLKYLILSLAQVLKRRMLCIISNS